MTSDVDRLEEITDFPQSSIGAPIPVVLSNEHRLYLCYYIENESDDWDGTTTKVMSAETTDETVAVVKFDRYAVYKFGPPNEETIAGHPLYKKGLRAYSIYKIIGSSWIEELERMNSVHRYHDKKQFESLNHFIFVFHDSTFECVSKTMTFTTKSGSIKSIMSGLSENCSAPAFTMDLTITCTPDSFTVSHDPHGETLSYRFDDISKVIVRTTADGPFSEDIFYEIVTPSGAIVLPSQADGMKTLIDDHLLKLPGFDYEAFIKAMGSTGDQAFVCFERE